MEYLPNDLRGLRLLGFLFLRGSELRRGGRLMLRDGVVFLRRNHQY